MCSYKKESLLSFVSSCFERVGLEAEHAAIVSRLLVNNDLRGVRSHGSRTVDMYCEGFERGAANPRPEVKVLHETPTSTVLEWRWHDWLHADEPRRRKLPLPRQKQLDLVSVW